MKKVIVIGAGVSGLSCAITLQSQGFNCHIFERNPFVGGNLTGWDRNGYHIDNCIHFLCGTNKHAPINQLWRSLGAFDDSLVVQTKSLYTSEYGGERISMWSNAEKTQRDMLLLSPKDKKEINRLFDAINALMCRESDSFSLSTLLQGACKLKILRYYNMSLYDLARKFSHPLLRRLMTDYIPGEFSSLGLILAYASFASSNGALLKGGSKQMASRMEAHFRSLGGTVHTCTEIKRIVHSKSTAKGVITADGRLFLGDYVVCACDPYVTFSKLLNAVAPKNYTKKLGDNYRYPLFSSVHCAFSCEGEKPPFHSSFIFECDPLFDDRTKHGRLCVREFSHDKSFSPDGKSIIQCMIFQHKDQCEQWINLYPHTADYEHRKKAFANAVKQRIEQRFPSLKLQILDVWTPATYKRYFGSKFGSYMSFALTKGCLPKSDSCKVFGYKNVFLASQWLTSIGGLPIAAQYGAKAANDVLKREQRRTPSNADDTVIRKLKTESL